MSECQHDYDNPVWKGRAKAVCKDCGEDITFMLVLIADSEQLSENDKHGVDVNTDKAMG